MMSIAFNNYQRDVLSRIPVVGDDSILYGSENRTNVVSSPNSVILLYSTVQSSFPSFPRPCCTVMNVTGCDQLPVLPIFPILFSASKTYRPHSIQGSGQLCRFPPSFVVSCASNMIPSTSHLSDPPRPIQLFIKSIRNMTISIHIDSTSSISDLKHLIYAHDGIPPCDKRLMHRGRELRDDAFLSGLDVDGATITCLLRVVGGNLTGRIPLRWWFGFSRSYVDGRAGEGRIRHVLSEIEFEGAYPGNWFSDAPLSDWKGIVLESGIVLIDHFNISRRCDKNFKVKATELPHQQPTRFVPYFDISLLFGYSRQPTDLSS